MNECPICFETRNLSSLSCSHSFCRRCITRWRISCPMCRSPIEATTFDISTNNLTLKDSDPRRLNISIQSPKGTSLPIQKSELNILRRIFGNFNKIDLENINNYDKIIFQNYKSNCWWVGIILSKTFDSITIDNSIYLQRGNGSIYNASPLIRTINIGEYDTYFILNR